MEKLEKLKNRIDELKDGGLTLIDALLILKEIDELRKEKEQTTELKKEPTTLIEKVEALPEGVKFLISYVHDGNVFDRCFISMKPSRDGEVYIYPDTILKFEKDLELEKGYKNVKIINLVELD